MSTKKIPTDGQIELLKELGLDGNKPKTGTTIQKRKGKYERKSMIYDTAEKPKKESINRKRSIVPMDIEILNDQLDDELDILSLAFDKTLIIPKNKISPEEEKEKLKQIALDKAKSLERFNQIKKAIKQKIENEYNTIDTKDFKKYPEFLNLANSYLEHIKQKHYKHYNRNYSSEEIKKYKNYALDKAKKKFIEPTQFFIFKDLLKQRNIKTLSNDNLQYLALKIAKKYITIDNYKQIPDISKISIIRSFIKNL